MRRNEWSRCVHRRQCCSIDALTARSDLDAWLSCAASYTHRSKYGPGPDEGMQQSHRERTLPFLHCPLASKHAPAPHTHGHPHTNRSLRHEALRGLGLFGPVPLLGLPSAGPPPFPPVDAAATPAPMRCIRYVCLEKDKRTRLSSMRYHTHSCLHIHWPACVNCTVFLLDRILIPHHSSSTPPKQRPLAFPPPPPY